MNITSGLIHLETSFNKSLFGIRMGTGIAGHPYSGVIGLTNLDFLHHLSLKKINISIGFRLQKVINITENYKFDFNHNLYGININFGKFFLERLYSFVMIPHDPRSITLPYPMIL